MSDHNTLEQLLEHLRKDASLEDSLSLYAQKKFKRNQPFTDTQIQRKKEFLVFIKKYISDTFDSEMADEIEVGLENNFCVSTAGHHGPMGHPFFYHATVLRSTYTNAPIINFNVSQVSLGNSSYPRGLVFHGNKKGLPYLHLPFFGSNKRMSPVYGTPGFTIQDIEQTALTRLLQYKKENLISSTEYSTLYTFLEENVLNDKLLSRRRYSEQITLLNYNWWKKLFQDKFSKVLEFDIEDIVSSIIQKLLPETNPISEMLCSVSLQNNIEKKFNNIDCCFSLEDHSGTYFFWHLDKEGKRWSMWRDGEQLRSTNKLFAVLMTPTSLIKSLEEGSLIPSGMLVYIIIIGYFGLTSFGGIFQSKYLAKIIQTYWELFPDESNVSKTLSMSTICADMYFIFSKENFPLTALDMVIDGNDINYNYNLSALESIKNSFTDL